MSAAAEGTTWRVNLAAGLCRDPGFSSKIKKPSQSSEYLTRDITTGPTKLMLANAPFLQVPTSGSSSSQEEVPVSDENNSHSDSSNSGADVEKVLESTEKNLFLTEV